MRSAWGSRLAAERAAVPLEMRFIDLFMAALGALIFMAMMLAFLLRFTPAHDARPAPADPAPPPAAPLRIVTGSLRTLPAATFSFINWRTSSSFAKSGIR